MNNLITAITIIAISNSTIAHGDSKEFKQNALHGEIANSKINDFLRGGRQIWQIEYRVVGHGITSSVWHVKGTDWWVRLDGPDHSKEFINLKNLDTTKSYEFEGLPVELNYGAITFYVTSGITIIDPPKQK